MVLGIHHVFEYTADHAPADWGFLASGMVLVFAGGALIRAGGRNMSPPGTLPAP